MPIELLPESSRRAYVPQHLRLPLLGYNYDAGEQQVRGRSHRPVEVKPRSIGTGKLRTWERRELANLEAELCAEGVSLERPKVYPRDCPPPGTPCPWAGCAHSLLLDVIPAVLPGKPPTIKLAFPARAIDELEETCALRVANAVPPGEVTTQDRIGQLTNKTMARVDQEEKRAVAKLRDLPEFAPLIERAERERKLRTRPSRTR